MRLRQLLSHVTAIKDSAKRAITAQDVASDASYTTATSLKFIIQKLAADKVCFEYLFIYDFSFSLSLFLSFHLFICLSVYPTVSLCLSMSLLLSSSRCLLIIYSLYVPSSFNLPQRAKCSLMLLNKGLWVKSRNISTEGQMLIQKTR